MLPAQFTKGDVTKTAHTAAQAVALRFDGFVEAEGTTTQDEAPQESVTETHEVSQVTEATPDEAPAPKPTPRAKRDS